MRELLPKVLVKASSAAVGPFCRHTRSHPRDRPLRPGGRPGKTVVVVATMQVGCILRDGPGGDGGSMVTTKPTRLFGLVGFVVTRRSAPLPVARLR